MSISYELNLKSIISDLSCPICLCILSKTTVVDQKCLHRFCYDCINTALRLGKKECPSCRAPCPKRNLRTDSKFDNIIAKLYPESVKGNDSIGNSPLENTVLSNKKLPKKILSRSGKIEKAIHGNVSDHKRNLKLLKLASLDSTQSISTTSNEEDESPVGFIEFNPKNSWNIEIELIPDPREMDSQKSISIRTQRECTGQHLADCLKAHLGSNQQIAFFFNDGKGFVDIDLENELSKLVRYDLFNAKPFINFVPIYYKFI